MTERFTYTGGSIVHIRDSQNPDYFVSGGREEIARIVACLAACEGIATESLSGGLTARIRQANRIEEALITALPYVEMAEHDPAYRPGAVAKVVRQIKSALSRTQTQPAEAQS